MLEESKMDKKSVNRSSQVQSRPPAVDCKKPEASYKPWPRNNKKREGPNSAPKNDPYRRNAPMPKGRAQMDKRPRARGPSNFTVGGTENTGIGEDDEPEYGSVFVPGSKKQSLNHLLNFMYPTRGGNERGTVAPRRQAHPVSHRHEHDLYLRAYCQFVVKEDGDYKIGWIDPDMPIKWEQIEEIVVRSTGKSECPICLGTPVAGRVGLCGHVYCWACVLHYAQTHDKQPPPCPVCSTKLLVHDMKPTRMLQWESSVEEVTVRLVRRLRGSTVVEAAPPRGEMVEPTENVPLPLQLIEKAPFAKLFGAGTHQIKDILERERKEIEQQILAEIDTTEIVYLEQALEMLKQKEESMNKSYEKPKPVIETKNTDDAPTVYQKQEINDNKIDWFDMPEGASYVPTNNDYNSSEATENACYVATNNDSATIENAEEIGVSLSNLSLNPDAPEFVCDTNIDNMGNEEFPLTECTVDEEQSNDNDTITEIDKQNQAKYFYFYQSADGQQVFLHSVNVRVLGASWGALAAAPRELRGRVLHRETFSLNHQTRKHLPYTSHLPLHCSFDVVELDLEPPYVTKEALRNFKDELDRLARSRARHAREERRRERAHTRAVQGPPKPDFSSEILFPAALPSPPNISIPVELQEGPSTANVAASPSGVSWSKMASTSGTWRVRRVAGPPSPPPAPADEDPAAPRALNLSDAIEAALLSAPAAPSAGKKKKSKQKTLLFATGMQRSA